MRVARINCRLYLSPLWAGLLIIGGLAPLFAAAGDDTDAVQARVDDGLVSVTANDAPVRNVIEAIADAADLRLVEHIRLTRRVTLDVDRRPLPDVLAELLEKDSYTLYQAAAPDDGDAEVIPGTLWVFSEGTSLAPAATIFFEAVLYQGTYAEKKEAIRELRRLGTPAAVQALSLALGDDDPRVRDAALFALSQIGSDESLAAIASTAMDTDPHMRAEAAAALASADSESSARYLAMALDDPNPGVRIAVIESLTDVPFGAVPSDIAVATLSRALQDEDAAVRMAAVDAMEEIGGEVAFRLLVRLRGDEDADVADAIDEALEFLQNSR